MLKQRFLVRDEKPLVVIGCRQSKGAEPGFFFFKKRAENETMAFVSVC